MTGHAGSAEDLVVRLRKVEGQVRGLQHLAESGTDIDELLTQLRGGRTPSVAAPIQVPYLRRMPAEPGRADASTTDRRHKGGHTMEQERRNTWIVLGAMVAFLLVPVLIVVGLLIGASGGDDGVSAPTTAPSPVTTEALGDDRFASMEVSGGVRTMVEQHQAMMDQMRVNATPQMLQLMNSDPMWQMMRSGEYVRLLEEHEKNIDQMLARGQ